MGKKQCIMVKSKALSKQFPNSVQVHFSIFFYLSPLFLSFQEFERHCNVRFIYNYDSIPSVFVC